MPRKGSKMTRLNLSQALPLSQVSYVTVGAFLDSPRLCHLTWKWDKSRNIILLSTHRTNICIAHIWKASHSISSTRRSPCSDKQLLSAWHKGNPKASNEAIYCRMKTSFLDLKNTPCTSQWLGEPRHLSVPVSVTCRKRGWMDGVGSDEDWTACKH